jgi:carbamoyl-phosphate synthase small subunit
MPADAESDAVHAAGLIIRDLPLVASNFRSEQSLADYLVAIIRCCISDIDTRKLTRIIREKGAQAGCILTGDAVDEAAAIAEAQSFPGLKGMDLAKVVTTNSSYEWTDPPGSWAWKRQRDLNQPIMWWHWILVSNATFFEFWLIWVAA